MLLAVAAADDAAAPYPSSEQPLGTEPLFAVSTDGLSGADIITLESLAGGMARKCPNVYRLAGELDGGDSAAFWLRQLRAQRWE